MRYQLILLLMLTCCQRAERVNERFPLPTDRGWVSFEGRIPLDDKRSLYVEVSLKADAQPGEGYYILHETIESSSADAPVFTKEGKYSHSLSPQQKLVMHLENSGLNPPLKRSFVDPKDGKYYRERFRKGNLQLARNSDDVLEVLNVNGEPLAGIKATLARRTSRMFTVEGKFAHVGDSAVFLETNTDQRWAVSKLGVYDQAIRQYHQLAVEKNEGIYLKGVACTVSHVDEKGKDTEAIVFKRIIQMSSEPMPDQTSE